MIWPIVPLLKRYALPIGILLLVTLAYGWHRTEVNGARRAGYDQARGEYKAQVDKANAATAARDAAARKAFQANESRWIGERSELQTQIADLAGRIKPVRLCKPAAPSGQLPGASAAASSSGGAGQSGVDAMQAGQDIGPAIAVFAGECESYRRRLIELKGRWPEQAISPH